MGTAEVSELENIRRELIRLCGSKRTRLVPADAVMPCRWWPTQTLDPRTGQPFTEAGAWEFVVAQLTAGAAPEVIELQKPPGKKGYVLTVDGYRNRPQIYIKLQIVSGAVCGRSFHDSESASEQTSRQPFRRNE